MQTLEGSLVGQEWGLSVQDPAQDSQPTRLPAHIREIVTRNLSQPESSGMPACHLHKHCLHLSSLIPASPTVIMTRIAASIS